MRDLIIIGAGPAGLSAAIYSRRFLLDTVVIGELFGGLLTTTHLIENWPGEQGISGMDLMNKLESHARGLGSELINSTVKKVSEVKGGFRVETTNDSFSAKSIIIATGTVHRRLGVPGEGKYYGRGVSYCAACDAPLFKDKVVGVVGGSHSAAKEALLLAQHAKKVYIIYRRDKLRAEPIICNRVNDKISEGKIEFVTNTNVIEVLGDDNRISGVKLDTGNELSLDGLFIEIGLIPRTDLVKSLGVDLNERGEIIVNREMKTNVNGLFAAGDCTDSPVKQAITGAADGVIASFSAFDFISKP